MDACHNCKRPVLKFKTAVCAKCGTSLCLDCARKKLCADCFVISEEKRMIYDYFEDKYCGGMKC